MSPISSKPTIVFVQGLFQTPLVYQKLVDGLESSGYDVVYPNHPSCSAPDLATRTLHDDAQSLRRELIRLITKESRKVVVVMHSYGGLVGSEAVSEDLSHSYRQTRSLSGGVVHLFYYSAFILPKGQSIMSTFGESPNNDVRADGRFTIRNASKTIYNDLPDSEAAEWESRIILVSYKVQLTKLTCEGYRYVPSTYLVCGRDQAAPPQYQEMFAKTANAKVEYCSASHSPHLSQPDMLVNKIDATIKNITGSTSREASPQAASLAGTSLSPRTSLSRTRSPRTGSPDRESKSTGSGSPRTGSPLIGSLRTGSLRTGSPRAGLPRTDPPRTGLSRTRSPRTESPEIQSKPAESKKPLLG